MLSAPALCGRESSSRLYASADIHVHRGGVQPQRRAGLGYMYFPISRIVCASNNLVFPDLCHRRTHGGAVLFLHLELAFGRLVLGRVTSQGCHRIGKDEAKLLRPASRLSTTVITPFSKTLLWQDISSRSPTGGNSFDQASICSTWRLGSHARQQLISTLLDGPYNSKAAFGTSLCIHSILFRDGFCGVNSPEVASACRPPASADYDHRPGVGGGMHVLSANG